MDCRSCRFTQIFVAATLGSIFVLSVGGSGVGAAEQTPSKPAPEAATGRSGELRGRLLASLDRGFAYLVAHQKEDGSWENDIGITGLAATAFLQAPPGTQAASYREQVEKSLAFIASKAQEDGGIYVREMPNYYTAVGMQALLASGEPKYRPLIQKAQKYLVGLQADEKTGFEKSDKFYGGFSYGPADTDERPDLANMAMALAALKDSGLPSEDPLWNRALQFIQRTQNRSESNDQAWAGNDGGFIYYPGFSYAEQGGTHSYASMTYAGLLSYAYANVGKDDPRVKAALDWIRKHYTVYENPGMGMKVLYYYYFVFAKALDALGIDVIEDVQGIRHDWRRDLGAKLLSLQHPEGYWVNEDPAWWQDNKVLVTAFTLQALEHILNE